MPNLNQGMPLPQTPIVDDKGLPTKPFYYLLLALWERTGGALGISTIASNDDLLVLVGLGDTGQKSQSGGGSVAEAGLFEPPPAKLFPELTLGMLLGADPTPAGLNPTQLALTANLLGD